MCARSEWQKNWRRRFLCLDRVTNATTEPIQQYILLMHGASSTRSFTSQYNCLPLGTTHLGLFFFYYARLRVGNDAKWSVVAAVKRAICAREEPEHNGHQRRQNRLRAEERMPEKCQRQNDAKEKIRQLNRSNTRMRETGGMHSRRRLTS